MNKHHFNYMLEDTFLGIKRNIGSVVASVALTFIALLLIGQVLLVKAFADDAIQYVESQLSMKVYVEDGLARDIAAIVEGKSFAANVEIESGTEMIENLSFFFVGKEHLLDSFTGVNGLDAVKFQVTDQSLMPSIAENLESVEGITKVVYPQQMAEILAEWIHKVKLFGAGTIIVFILLAFVMVYITFHLALSQRKTSLEVNLFLGLKPFMLRMQFLLEGSIIGFLSALLATGITAILFFALYLKINQNIPYIGQLSISDLTMVVLLQIVVAVGMSIAASFMATRKLINHV